MIASSSSSPPTRIDCDTTIPPSEITATSDVPPPMSTTMLPVGSPTGRPAPMAAAIGSSIRYAWRAPALRQASSTARFSTPVTPEGTQTTTRGCAQRFWCTFWMKWRSISSVTSKSAITPSLSGPDRRDRAGRAAEHALGLDPHRVDLAGARVDRDHARLGQHDAAAPYVDEGVGRAEVDRHVAATEAGEVREEAHEEEPCARTRGARPEGARDAAGQSTERPPRNPWKSGWPDAGPDAGAAARASGSPTTFR